MAYALIVCGPTFAIMITILISTSFPVIGVALGLGFGFPFLTVGAACLYICSRKEKLITKIVKELDQNSAFQQERGQLQQEFKDSDLLVKDAFPTPSSALADSKVTELFEDSRKNG